MTTYICYIKSHCEQPDFEYEVEAENKNEAVKEIINKIGKYGWEEDLISQYTCKL